jgi:dihydroorotase
MRLALEYSKPFDVVISQHSQDEALSEGWQMHEGHYSALLGLTGAPAEAEEIIVARDIALARLTGGRLHVTHVSSAGTVEVIRQAAHRRLPLTADVTPHHLALADEDLVTYDTNLKVNPPLRSVEHRDGLRAGVAEGLIDAIATDHAPHAVEEKEQEFDQAPPGTTGLETALAVVLTELVEPGILDLPTALRRMSTGPAHILRLDDQGGPLEPGSAANLMAFDPTAEWTVEPGAFESKSRNSAFLGRALRGRVIHTVFRGELVVHEGKAQK